MRHGLLVTALALLTVGTASAGAKFADVVQLAPDTYQISRIDHGGIFGNAGKMKTNVIREAQEFAESQGKVAVVQSIRETPMVVAHNFASIEYTFLVVDKNDADARRAHLVKEPDQVTEAHVKVDVKSDQPVAKPDLYSDLIKLDDLRKRGLLTDAEFEEQKRKLLEK